MGRCYNCGSPYHYSNNCPKSKEMKSNKSRHRCKEPGHLTKSVEMPNKNNSIINHLTSSLECNLILDGMWGKESALISKDCLLYEIKLTLLNKLVENNIITIETLDERNRTPHININGNQEVYQKLNNSSVIVNNTTIKISKNIIELAIDSKHHVTLCYSPNVIIHQDKIYTILNNILYNLTNNNDKTLCVVCMEEDKDILIHPCNHVCVCSSCITMITSGQDLTIHDAGRCPICRSSITSYEKIFIS